MTAAEARRELVTVLLRVEELLQLPDCDVNWSCWKDPTDALAAIRADRELLERGDVARAKAVYILFLPTGEIGEVAICSGWGDEYMLLAKRVDDAYEALKPE